MISNDFAIELAQLGLRMEKIQASVAAENIAFANIRQSTQVVDFDRLISDISESVDIADQVSVSEVLQEKDPASLEYVRSLSGAPSLDTQIMELSSASGRYKVISEALSRKFGLMSLAVSGR